MEHQSEQSRDDKSDRPFGPSWVESEAGLILLDSSYKPVVFNREAAIIFNYSQAPTSQQESRLRIPEELLARIRQWCPTSSSFLSIRFRSGRREYVCQSYLLESQHDSWRQALLALLLRRVSSPVEIFDNIARTFSLTEREREALIGVSIGLGNKELADRMSISPNTVKAHIRLIALKMGVRTRGEMLAKILGNQQS